MALQIASSSKAELQTFEYEIVAKTKRPWWTFWQFWRPKDIMYGTLVARSQQAALDVLNSRKGVTIVDVRALPAALVPLRRAFFHSRVKTSVVLEFIANYAAMTDGGIISPSEACETLAVLQSSAYMTQVLQTMAGMLRGSVRLYEAAAFFPAVFPPYVVAVIRAGEGMDILPEVLADLEDTLRNRGALDDLVRALRNDVLQVGGSIVVLLGVFFLFFVPVLIASTAHDKLGNSHAIEAPWWLVPVLAITGLLQSWVADAAILIGAFVAFFIFRIYIATTDGRYRWESFVLKRTGTFGKLIALRCQAEAMRAYARLYNLGTPPFEAWTEAAPTADNLVYSEAFIDIRDRTHRGIQLWEALRDSKMFDLRAIAMIKAAEPNGPDVLARRMLTLSTDFRAESIRRFSDMSRTWHVRLQYLFAGIIVFVTFIALALFGNTLANIGG